MSAAGPSRTRPVRRTPLLVAALLGAIPALLAPQDVARDATDVLARFEESLRSHPYLGRVAYTRVDEFAPFYFFVTRPDTDETGYYGRVAGQYGPWFRELERLFVEQYVQPLKLTRRSDHVLYSTFVLGSSGDYKNYADGTQMTGLYAARAHYDPELGAAVTYENTYQLESKSQHRRAALHELVHALQHAYSAEADRLPAVAWFNEGLADYLSYCEGLAPPALTQRKPDVEALKVVASLAPVQGALAGGLFPFEELAVLRDYGEVEARFQDRAGLLFGQQGLDLGLALFYAQSSLWTYYLQHGDGGRHRDAYLAFALAALRGTSGSEALGQAFASTNLVALDRSFRLWLQKTIAERLKVSVGIPLEAVRSTGGSQPASAPPGFVPAELRPVAVDPEIGFALALAEAQRGALAAAEQRLTGLASAPEPLRARCARELERVRAFRALRRRFFEHLAQPTARKLDTEVRGQKLVAQVTALEGERARLGANKRGLDVLELDALPALTVAELTRDKKYAFEADPAAGWAFLLAGDERWKKLVPAGDPLRADEADYAARLDLARAASTLLELAEGGAPADAAAAERALARVQELQAKHAALPLVTAKRAPLRALARASLERLFERDGFAACLRGKVESLGEGRVRLTYGFDAPEELGDFTQTDYLSSMASGRARQDFSVAGGRLIAGGYACLRTKLAFQGTQLVRCRARFNEPQGSYDPRVAFLLGLNDDGLLSFAGSDFDGTLRVMDLQQNYVQQTQGSGQILIGETYVLELTFDGSSLAASVNGQPRARVSTGPRQKGAMVLFTATDFLLGVEELVLEGTPTPESLTGFREEWVAGRLSALGF